MEREEWFRRKRSSLVERDRVSFEMEKRKESEEKQVEELITESNGS
jgi:hypothetical protein